MKTLLFFILTSISTASLGQQTNPFPKLKFDRVVMYDYEPDGEKSATIINTNGKLSSTIIKGITLDSPTVVQLNKKLGDKKSYGGSTASCFDPHLGLVYYLGEKVVAHVSICFSCNRLRSSIDIPAKKQGKVRSGDEVYYIADGLSKSFRSFLNNLIKRHDFSHQIEPGFSFDD